MNLNQEDIDSCSLDELEAAAEILDRQRYQGRYTLRRTIIITKERIDAIFTKHTHQADVLIDLYKLIIPRWDWVKKINGWPKIGKEAGDYIAKKFRDFDKLHHPEVMQMGLWLNSGFSRYEADHLAPWEIEANGLEIDYPEVEA